MIKGTYEQAPRLLDQVRLKRLLAMLQSMSQRFPQSELRSNSQGGFGVLLPDGRSINVCLNGSWSDGDLRDFLQLFAMWSLADRQGLTRTTSRSGASRRVREG